MVCPRCSEKSSVDINRQPAEKFVEKDSKRWLILYCSYCQFNFDLVEWEKKEGPKKRLRSFKSFFRDEVDEE